MREVNEMASLEENAPVVDLELDPGIRHAVLVLRSGGIDTFESCEGGQGHACPEPMVRFNGDPWEGFKALSVAMSNGLPVLALRHVWDITDGLPVGPWWETSFRTTGLR